MTKRPARRRRPQPPSAMQTMPLWKRTLGAAFFMVGGGGAAVWGIYDLAAWIGSLHRGEDLIETENFIIGLPLMGLALCSIGPEFILPKLLSEWSDTLKVRVAGVVLGSLLAGIVLALLGQLVINVTMEVAGYHACEVHGRGRVTDVTWARADTVCHKTDPGL